MDDADYGDDTVDLSDVGSELEDEDGSAPRTNTRFLHERVVGGKSQPFIA
jgi:hypothetical protein